MVAGWGGWERLWKAFSQSTFFAFGWETALTNGLNRVPRRFEGAVGIPFFEQRPQQVKAYLMLFERAQLKSDRGQIYCD